MQNSWGIASLGVHFPPLYFPVDELAKIRNVDPMKFLHGLGCKHIAVCPKDYGVVELGVEAAKRALARWSGSLADIGLIAVGTESSLDMSRPLSAWIAAELGLEGAVRSYEVKHACYGGTLAIKQAIEWKMSGAAAGKAALVIATDISVYAPQDPGEATGGAGAVALIIDEPLIAEINTQSFPWSKPAFDFWRPVGHAYPVVEGQFSLACYKEAAVACFQASLQGRNPDDVLNELKFFCFHTPFSGMVKKAWQAIGEHIGWNEQQVLDFYQEKILPTMEWNKLSGNSYTASLWLAVARALAGMQAHEQLYAFSYGSGYGAELLSLKAGANALVATWQEDVAQDVRTRRCITAAEYEELIRL